MSASFSNGKKYLTILLQRLSNIRGKESRYLKPLLSKMDHVLASEMISTSSLLEDDRLQAMLEADAPASPLVAYPNRSRPSIRESLGMLRTLSMSGTICIPDLSILEDWTS
jgi:hypothetical protein